MRRTLGALPLALLLGCGPRAPAAHGPGAGGASPAIDAGVDAAPAAAGPPVAAVRPVIDTYFGVEVTDPYRWLEADDADVQAWSDGQDRYARGVLDHLPGVDTLRAELAAIDDAPITSYAGFRAVAGRLFGLRSSPGREQPDLVVIDDPAHPEAARRIVDPTAQGGALTTIDWFVPSPDGKAVAVSMSAGGSEAGALHLLDLDGHELEPAIPDVQHGTAGGSVAWTPDSAGFYYTRYPSADGDHADERDLWMQVYFHRLGDDAAADRHELGDGFPKIAEIALASDARGRVLASVQDGDSGRFQHYLRAAKGGWRRLDDWGDGVIAADFGPRTDLYLVSTRGAPRGRVLRLGATQKLARAKVVVPEGTDAIVTDPYAGWGVLATADRLYVLYQTGGPSELRAFTLAGKPAKAPTVPPVASASPPVPWAHGVLYAVESYTTVGWYRFDARTAATDLVPALSEHPAVDLSGYEVRRELATSKDGTRVPVNIVWPTGAAQDGTRPCVVTGYGGYGISEAPRPLFRVSVLLSRGVCWVDVNLRGGAEFGQGWHDAGRLTRKQNVFDDFAAALEHVVAQGYTSSDRLAIQGGSNGGLLMGAMITQHPDLMKAVVAMVGIYDMLRVERSPNGKFNIPEYGTVTDEAQFRALYAYSPYHHVTAGTRYPAVLMTTGANDPRVSPWQSRKMVAALQAAQAADAPILLRTSASAGHGRGTSKTERTEETAHRDAFLLWQLGVTP